MSFTKSSRLPSALIFSLLFSLFSNTASTLADVTDTAVYAPPSYTTFTPPAAGGSYTDPVFGTAIKRLSNSMSMRRAESVASVLNQSGIPPTNLVVPAAMGESQQIAPSATTTGQAENRRNVVTLLQNKGIVEK